jgi:hypothetical protein
VEDLPGDPAPDRRAEEGDQARAVLRTADPTERHLCLYPLAELGRDPTGVGRARVDGIDRDAQRRELGGCAQGQPFDRALTRRVGNLSGEGRGAREVDDPSRPRRTAEAPRELRTEERRAARIDSPVPVELLGRRVE